jgi:hypothetical protein
VRDSRGSMLVRTDTERTGRGQPSTSVKSPSTIPDNPGESGGFLGFAPPSPRSHNPAIIPFPSGFSGFSGGSPDASLGTTALTWVDRFPPASVIVPDIVTNPGTASSLAARTRGPTTLSETTAFRAESRARACVSLPCQSGRCGLREASSRRRRKVGSVPGRPLPPGLRPLDTFWTRPAQKTPENPPALPNPQTPKGPVPQGDTGPPEGFRGARP